MLSLSLQIKYTKNTDYSKFRFCCFTKIYLFVYFAFNVMPKLMHLLYSKFINTVLLIMVSCSGLHIPLTRERSPGRDLEETQILWGLHREPPQPSTVETPCE